MRDWDALIDLILTIYDTANGTTMVCALVFDDPVKSCTPTSTQGVFIVTLSSRYLSATNGSGVPGVDAEGRKRALATVARYAGPSERFVAVPQQPPAGQQGTFVAFRTPDGAHYLTAINEGTVSDPESALQGLAQPDKGAEFTLVNYADGTVAFRTADYHYLSAVDLGGIGEDANAYAFHSDATAASAWETFRLMPQ